MSSTLSSGVPTPVSDLVSHVLGIRLVEETDGPRLDNSMLDDRVVVQIGTYNANLQGNEGLPQNLVDWLVPSLQVSTFLGNTRTAPDFVAIGFQELLPLQFGCKSYPPMQQQTPRTSSVFSIVVTGLSNHIMRSRNQLIRSQLEIHAPQKEQYTLVAEVVNVGIALLVYARDDTVALRVSDVQTQWTTCGPGWMGNKGAVGVRFVVASRDGGPGEIYTFVNAHLTPHESNSDRRIADYKHIVQTLLFSSTDPSLTGQHANIYDTTHLFFFGDLNFRVDPPVGMDRNELESSVRTEQGREQLRQHDQLNVAKAAGKAFNGLHEGEFWKFQCTYRHECGQVDQYQ